MLAEIRKCLYRQPVLEAVLCSRLNYLTIQGWPALPCALLHVL